MTRILQGVQTLAVAVMAAALLLAMVPHASAQESLLGGGDDAQEDSGGDGDEDQDDSGGGGSESGDLAPDGSGGEGGDAEAQETEEQDAEEASGSVTDSCLPVDEGDLSMEGLSGPRIEANAAPVKIRLFEPTIPLPVDPGEPQLEFALGYSSSSVGGGTSRGLSSLLWPGSAVGDGFGTLMGEFGGPTDQSYPIRASAPSSGEPVDDEVALPTGAGMFAQGRAAGACGHSDFLGQVAPMLAEAETLTSTSSSVVHDGVATARAVTRVEDLSLLDGIIRVGAIGTDLEATSDGASEEQDGTFEITDLEIAGQQFVVDADGVRAETDTGSEDDGEGDGDGGPLGGLLGGLTELPLNLIGTLDLQELVGVKVEAVPTTTPEDEDGTEGTREVEGLRITLDLNPLLEVVNSLPLSQLSEQMPQQFREQLALVRGLGPTVEVALGSASVQAQANEARSFEAPEFDGPSGGGGSADVGGIDTGSAPTGSPSSGGDLSAPQTAAPDAGGGGGTGQQEAPQVAQSVGQEQSLPDLFSGLPAPVVALAAGVVAAAAWGLQRLTTAAMVPAAAGATSSGPVPDLRSWAGR